MRSIRAVSRIWKTQSAARSRMMKAKNSSSRAGCKIGLGPLVRLFRRGEGLETRKGMVRPRSEDHGDQPGPVVRP
jgi:hypothetical protein